MDALRLGIVGAGSIGAAHASAAAVTPQVRVAAVCDLNAEVGRRLAERCDAPYFASHAELIGSGDVDAVVVNTPHALHTEIVVAAAAAGLHVLVEKPMATTVADCDAMIAACEHAGVTLAVGHVQRFFADRVALKSAVEAGQIGALRLILDNRMTDYHAPSRPSWYLSPDIAGGGVFFNIGAHSVDRALWLSGQHVRSVEATLARRDGFAVETDAAARLELSGGATAQIAVTDVGTFARDEITLVGDEGAVRYSRDGGVLLHRGGEETVLHPAGKSGGAALAAQLADFADAIAGARPPSVGGAHGREVVATILAAYESGGSRRPVTLGAS